MRRPGVPAGEAGFRTGCGQARMGLGLDDDHAIGTDALVGKALRRALSFDEGAGGV